MHRTTHTVAALMIGASSIAMATPALATDTVFSTASVEIREGARTNHVRGVTQVRLNNGAMASFVDAADFRINADGTIDLYAGGVTVAAGADGAETLVRMPDGVEGRVAGRGAAASFSVGPDGTARGHALSGEVRVGRAGDLRSFDGGDMFATARGGSIRQVVSNGVQSTPDAADGGDASAGAVAAMGGDAGPVAAAQNGLPVSLGDALAAAGASADILGAARRVEAAVANPAIDTFPSGDLGLLVAAAADLEGAFGGTPFPQAQADIIRTYLGFLASGGSGADFLTAYSGFLVRYFGLIRSGGAPGDFALANVEDINAFTAFLARSQGFAALSAQDRALADAYLAFIAQGGDPARFAGTFTDLTEVYFAFLRAGGNPQDFTDASLATVEAYIAFLDASGLAVRLGASDRALLDAYLANGGVGFLGEYRAALDDYFAFLASGRRPSEYDGADVAVLLGYVQTLQSAGLLEATLGGNAQFFADYAAFVQGGGQIDAFGQLNANIFAGYADALRAYFAFLDAGGVPSAYAAGDVDVLNDYLAQLAAAGALDRFLGDTSGFFADYLAFLQGGGTLDTYAGLNANIFAGYAEALAAYYAYLENGGVPSGYTALDQETIAAYLAALARVGATDSFLADLAGFYADYFAFVAGGGNPDNFAGLPVPPDFPAFASALNAYAAFLGAGGLPSDYDAAELAVLQNYLEAIVASGQLAALLGDNADLLTGYFTFLAAGGSADGFSGLPLYADYVTALNAYFAFLQNGGLPADYAALDQATIAAYLAALNDAGGLAAYGSLDAFFTGYFAFVAAGGDPARFAGLPIYADYVAALNAYYAFIAEGGRPSAYTLLTQAEVEAYLSALAGTVGGGFANFAGLNAFFVQYFAYLDEGGDPDQFAGLPGGGPRGPVGPSPQLGAAYASLATQNGLPAGPATAQIDDEGRITRVSVTDNASERTFDYTQRGDDIREFGRFGDAVAWSRYHVGATANARNVSEHLLVGTPATDLPAQGTIDYALVGGTAPTSRTAETGSVGWFTGNLSVLFGTTPLIGLDFEVYDRGEGYAVGTSGGAADPSDGGLTLGAAMNFSADYLGIRSISGNRCGSGTQCFAYVDGGLFGTGASHAGFIYNISDTSANISIQGSAVFGQSGDALAGIGNPDQVNGSDAIAGGYMGGAIDDFGRLGYVGSADRNGAVQVITPFVINGSSFVAGDNGSFESITFPNGNSIRNTGARTVFAAGDDDLLLGTLSDGELNFLRFDYLLGINQGYHFVYAPSLSAPIALPATGKITYDLLAATPVTIADGSLTPGVFDGRMALFLGQPNNSIGFAIDATASVGSGADEVVFSFLTPGGIDAAGPASDALFSLAGFANSGQFTLGGAWASADTDGYCPASGCRLNLAGTADASAERIALLYQVITQQVGDSISGGALFGNASFTDGGTGGGDSQSFLAGDGNAPVGTSGDQVAYITAAAGSAVGVANPITVTDGVLIAADLGLERISLQPTADAETQAGGSEGVLGWSRINDFGGSLTNSNRQSFALTPFPSRYLHGIWGTPAVDLPTGGLVNYELVGWTEPTATNATDISGSTFAGALAIDFGELTVGLIGTVDTGSQTYTFASEGGVADPTIAISTDPATLRGNIFTASLATVDGSGNEVVRGTLVRGFLAGEGASHVGIVYGIRVASSNQIEGSAAFRATEGTSVTDSAAMRSAFGGPTGWKFDGADLPLPGRSAVASDVAVAAQVPAIADWSRWTATGDARPDRMLDRAPGVDAQAVIDAGAQGSRPDPRSMLGGLITFGEVR